jgi:excinuclease ABC subunit C
MGEGKGEAVANASVNSAKSEGHGSTAVFDNVSSPADSTQPSHPAGEGGIRSSPGEGEATSNEQPAIGEAPPPHDWPDDIAAGDYDADTPVPDAKASRWAAPDLVLIDGGAGQLTAAQEVLDELGITDIPLAGIAKGPDRNAGREHFFMRGRPSFMLEPRDSVLYFVQRLRDEAHRFAIGTHRAKRSKAIAANPLDEIPGVGAKRRRALLKHFGSAKAISRAGVEDLQAVEGISAAMAQVIYDFFRGETT